MKIALRQFLIGRSAPEQLLILRLALMMKSLDPPRILWSDTEIFSNEIVAGHEVNYSSAPTARVLEQLNGEAPYVSGAASFAWQYLSPSLGLWKGATRPVG